MRNQILQQKYHKQNAYKPYEKCWRRKKPGGHMEKYYDENQLKINSILLLISTAFFSVYKSPV